MAPTKVNTPEGWAPTSLPPLVFANPCLSWCRLSNSPFYMSIRVTGFYRVKDQHVSSLMKMTREEKDNFQPQPSEADRRYEKSSHVEIVDSLLPPTVVDTRKSLEDARAKGAAHELPIQDGEVGEGTRGEKRPRSSDEVVGGPSQGEEGVEGGGVPVIGLRNRLGRKGEGQGGSLDTYHHAISQSCVSCGSRNLMPLVF